MGRRFWGNTMTRLACPTRRHVLAILAASAALGRWPAGAAEPGPTLTLSTGMREPWTTPQGTGFTDLLVAELFQRIGLSGRVVVNLAASRALRLADEGVDDGLAARVAGLEHSYPNLVPVPEPIFENDFVACSLGRDLATESWDSLRPFGIGYIIGWQIFDRNLPPVRELTQAKDSLQLFRLLDSNKVEFILHERWQARWQARQLGMTLTVHEPPLARVPMFLYVHHRHAALAPRLAAELQAMKADGSHLRITRRAFADLMP